MFPLFPLQSIIKITLANINTFFRKFKISNDNISKATKYYWFCKKSLLRPVICVKKNSLVPSEKLVTRENWDKLSVYFSTFEWWNWPKHQFCQITKRQMAFYGIAVNFIIQKLKSKRLAQWSWYVGEVLTK